MNNVAKTSLLAASSLLFCSSSFAAIVTQNFSGQFDFVDNAYISGEPTLSSLSLSASVFGSVTYDDALVAETGETFLGPVGLTLNFGSLSYTEADDLDYGLGPFPDADFLDGALVGIGFFTDQLDAFNEVIWELDAFGNSFGFYDFATGDMVASGTFNFASPVPIPTAIWLFSSGLIGLLGVARRKSND